MPAGSYVQLSDIPIVARKGTSPIRQISHKQVKQKRQCRDHSNIKSITGQANSTDYYLGVSEGHIPGSGADAQSSVAGLHAQTPGTTHANPEGSKAGTGEEAAQSPGLDSWLQSTLACKAHWPAQNGGTEIFQRS